MPLSVDIDPDLFSSPISGDFPAGENLQLSEEGRAVAGPRPAVSGSTCGTADSTSSGTAPATSTLPR